MLLLGVIYTTFKGENVLFKGHWCEGPPPQPGGTAHCSVGHLIRYGLFNPHLTYIRLYSTCIPVSTWSEQLFVGIHSCAQGKPSSTGRAVLPIGGLCSEPPPVTGHAWRQLFRRCTEIAVVLLPWWWMGHTSKVSAWDWGCNLWPQNADPRHKMGTWSVPFPWMGQHSMAPQSLL